MSRLAHLKSKPTAALISAAVLLSCLVAPRTIAGPANPGVVPPQADFRGKSYSEWSVLWWQWCFGLPAAGHPLSDITGADAAKGQSGNVWFLGGLWWTNSGTPPAGVVTRNITIPSGTALFFPIVNGENNYVEVPTASTLEDLLATLDWVDPITNDNLYATIDGKPLKDLTSYRAAAGPFAMTLPEGNFLQFWGVWDGSGEIDPVVADGFFLMVPPLSAGQHEITFGVKDLGFQLDIVYKIKVVPAGKSK